MLGLFGKKKATQVLGLDISSTTVKLLELSYSGGQYRVESYAVSSLPLDAVIEKNVNDVDGVSHAIRAVVAQSRTKLKNVAAAVAGSSVITKIIDMPDGLSDDEMETQLTLEADILFIEDMEVTFLEAKPAFDVPIARMLKQGSELRFTLGEKTFVYPLAGAADAMGPIEAACAKPT